MGTEFGVVEARQMGTNRAVFQSGPSIFKKLVRIVARTFYSGPCPPRPDGPVSRRKWDKVDTTGIAVIILDNLVQQEWVKEENLASELKIAPKLLLRALRYLERERILRHESRKEGKRAQAKDIVALMTIKEPPSNQDKTEAEAPPKPLLQSYWAIDYPSFWDVLRLRLHLMKFKIKSEVEVTNVITDYVCPQCSTRSSTLDFGTLLDRQTGRMLCEDCGIELLEECGNDGEGGRLEDRRKREEIMRAMLKKMDAELKPILDLMHQAKDIKPPDYGSLADWAYERNEKKKAKQAQANRGEGPDGMAKPEGAGSLAVASAELKRRQETAAKELPPWMVKTSRQLAEENAARKAQLTRRVEEILPPPQVEFQPTSDPTESVQPSALPAKRLKIDSVAAPPSAEDDDGIEWEDAGVAKPQPSGEDIPFDEEAARLADIESDIRTHSGWTTVQK